MNFSRPNGNTSTQGKKHIVVFKEVTWQYMVFGSRVALVCSRKAEVLQMSKTSVFWLVTFL